VIEVTVRNGPRAHPARAQDNGPGSAGISINCLKFERRSNFPALPRSLTLFGLAQIDQPSAAPSPRASPRDRSFANSSSQTEPALRLRAAHHQQRRSSPASVHGLDLAHGTGFPPATSTSVQPTSRSRRPRLRSAPPLRLRNRYRESGQLLCVRNRIDAGKVQHCAALVQPMIRELHLRGVCAAGARRPTQRRPSEQPNLPPFSKLVRKSVRISAKTSPLRPCGRRIRASQTTLRALPARLPPAPESSGGTKVTLTSSSSSECRACSGGAASCSRAQDGAHRARRAPCLPITLPTSSGATRSLRTVFSSRSRLPLPLRPAHPPEPRNLADQFVYLHHIDLVMILPLTSCVGFW